MKPRIPWKVYAIPVLLVLLFALIFSVPYLMHRTVKKADPKSGAAVPSQPAASGRDDSDLVLRRSNFAKWMHPRVDGLPWSAPMFDKLEVKAEPRLYCVAVDDGRCTCNTEQGTHYDVDVKMCRRIVQDGLYNPFVASAASPDSTSPHVSEDHQSAGRRMAALPPADRPVDDSTVGDVALADGWKASPVQSDYVPPELAKRPAYEPHALR